MADQDTQLLERRVGFGGWFGPWAKAAPAKQATTIKLMNVFMAWFLRHKIADSDEWIRSKVRVIGCQAATLSAALAGDGTAPSCCIMPSASYSSHSSAIFPPTMRSIITPLVVT